MARRTFLEFFAGGGMARAGLGEGWRCLFANDFDAKKAAAYARAWGTDGVPPPELRIGDVAALRTQDLPDARADLAWASFPCQDLSLAGNGGGLAGERSGSFMPFYFLMLGLREQGRAPRAIVLENVCGLLTSHGGRDFADICAMLARIGYRVGALVIDAADFLPQSRPRLFIIALDRTLPFDGAATPNARWHPPRLQEAQARLRADLRDDWLWFDPPAPPTRTTQLGDLIEADPVDVDWHTLAETDRIVGRMSEVNRAKLDTARLGQTGAWSAPSTTARASRMASSTSVRRCGSTASPAVCARPAAGPAGRSWWWSRAGGCARG